MFDIKALNMGNGVGEVLLFGDIASSSWDRWQEEDTTPQMFHDQLQALGSVKEIQVKINCYGGSVHAGRAMGAMLEERKLQGAKVVTVDMGIAASMAETLFQYGDERIMWAGTQLMMHKPETVTRGNADDHEKATDLLNKTEDVLIEVHMRHFNGTEDQLRQMFRNVTFLNADEALAYNLCDRIEGAADVAAHALGYRFGGLIVPKAYIGAGNIKLPENKGGEKMIYNKETDEKIKAALDEGKTITKNGDDIVVAEVAEAQEVTAFLTAEQVAEMTGVKDAKPDMVLGMLSALSGAGVTPANADDTLNALLEKAEKATELTAKAAERDHFFDLVLTEALENGIRAEGNTFDREGWEELLKMKPLAKVKEQSDKWLAKAEAELNAGGGRRSWTPGAESKVAVPDDCYTL